MWDRAFFHNLAYIFGKSGRIFMKILSQMYSWTRKSPLNLGSLPDPKSGSRVRIRTRNPDPDHIHLGGRMQSMTALVVVVIVMSRVGSLYCRCWCAFDATFLWPTVVVEDCVYFGSEHLQSLLPDCRRLTNDRTECVEIIEQTEILTNQGTHH